MFLASVSGLDSSDEAPEPAPPKKRQTRPLFEGSVAPKRAKTQPPPTPTAESRVDMFLAGFSKRHNLERRDAPPEAGAPEWKLEGLVAATDAVTNAVTDTVSCERPEPPDIPQAPTGPNACRPMPRGTLATLVLADLAKKTRDISPSAADGKDKVVADVLVKTQAYYNPRLGHLAGRERTWKDHEGVSDIVRGKYTLEEERILFDEVSRIFQAKGVDFADGCRAFIGCWTRGKMTSDFHLLVSKCLPRRTVKSVYQHLQKWYASLSLKRGAFSMDEMLTLKQCLLQSQVTGEPLDYASIAAEMGRYRTDIADKVSQMQAKLQHGSTFADLTSTRRSRRVFFTGEMDFHLLYHIRRLTGEVIPLKTVPWSEVQAFVPRATAGMCRKRFVQILLLRICASGVVDGIDSDCVTRESIRYVYRLLSTKASVPEEYKDVARDLKHHAKRDAVLFQVGQRVDGVKVQKFKRTGLIHSMRDVQWTEVFSPFVYFGQSCRRAFVSAAMKFLPAELMSAFGSSDAHIQTAIDEAVPAKLLRKQAKFLYKRLQCPYYEAEDRKRFVATLDWSAHVNSHVPEIFADMVDSGAAIKEAVSDEE